MSGNGAVMGGLGDRAAEGPNGIHMHIKNTMDVAKG